MIPADLQTIWVYLAAQPLLGLSLTLVAYLAGRWAYLKAKGSPFLNPVLVAVVILIVLLKLTRTDYQTYFQGAQFVHFLLGPATVALALPLYRQLPALRRSVPAVAAALIGGSIMASLSAMTIAKVLGAAPQIVLSMAPKSVTTPIAMGIAEKLGGLPAIAAIMVLVTGVSGAMMGRYVLNAVGVRDWRARGLAVGTAAHGQGTAVALHANETAGVFASIALGLNGILTALLVPVLLRLLG